ncbi:MAG: LytTR family DNA-binding domain-containing protein [Pseudomonadota bacterium]
MNDRQTEYANKPDNFADDTVLQSTLREMQSVFGNKSVWIGIAAIIAILVVSGPFGTLKSLNFGERLAYWGVLSVLTYACGLFVGTLTSISLKRQNKPRWSVWLLSSLAPSVPVTLVVWAANIFAFGSEVATSVWFMKIFGSSLIVSLAITFIYAQLRESAEEPERSDTTVIVPFLKRLPPELGKNLLYISSQDHYVEAVTSRGSDLILMRFSDAVAELEAMDGMQVHRAHWVATSAIVKPIRKDGKLLLEMSNGMQLPVSRTYSKSVRETLGL